MLPIAKFRTRTPLANFSLRYGNELSGYAAQKIFTPHPVPRAQGEFYVYSRDNLRVENVDAPRGSEAPGGEYEAHKKPYNCKERAWKGLILEKDARDADVPVAQLNQDQAMHNMDILMLQMEVACYAKVSDTNNYPVDLVETLTGTDVWTDPGADIIAQIRDMKEAVFTRCGRRPNALGISGKQLNIIKTHPNIVSRISGFKRDVTIEDLKALFDLQEIVVSDVAKNTAAKGQSDALSNVWGSTALVFYKDPAVRLKSLTYGKLFIVSEFYTKRIDAPELGRDGAAYYLESGWEWDMQFAAQASESDNDAIAGGIITATHS